MVHRDTKLLGYFESAAPWAQDAVHEIARCLTDAGYNLDLLIADSERRLLDSSPEGIRIVHSEPIFKSAALHHR